MLCVYSWRIFIFMQNKEAFTGQEAVAFLEAGWDVLEVYPHEAVPLAA